MEWEIKLLSSADPGAIEMQQKFATRRGRSAAFVQACSAFAQVSATTLQGRFLGRAAAP